MYLSATAFSHNVLDGLKELKQQLLRFSFFNLFIVAVLGLTLRSFPFASVPLNYRFLLHGHSHFAFGGWVMPILVWLIMEYFPELTQKIAFHHWRNIVWLLLLSGYGMLLSFPFQGYGVISIIFSTLSVLAGYYLAIVLWQASKKGKEETAIKFLRAGIFYMVLSSIGPFATGPLIAMGKSGTPLYFNAIYFYLHFQYNGWFTFAVLAVLFRVLEKDKVATHGNKIFTLLNLACAPTFLLSLLWNHPAKIIYVVGGIGALLQIIAVGHLALQFRKLKEPDVWERGLMNLAFTALILKVILQLLSAVPSIADLAFHNRNFIIAYLHLVLLGFISLFAVAFVVRSKAVPLTRKMKVGIAAFLFSLITSEVLLVLHTSLYFIHSQIPYFFIVLFCCSLFFPVGALLLFLNTGKQKTGSPLVVTGSKILAAESVAAVKP